MRLDGEEMLTRPIPASSFAMGAVSSLGPLELGRVSITLGSRSIVPSVVHGMLLLRGDDGRIRACGLGSATVRRWRPAVLITEADGVLHRLILEAGQ